MRYSVLTVLFLVFVSLPFYAQKADDSSLFENKNFFDTLDFVTANLMLPLGGLFIAVFAGWVMCRNSTAEELGGAGLLYRLWRVLARFLVPVGILFVFLKAVGLLPDLS